MSYVAVGVTVGSAIYKGIDAGAKRRKAKKEAAKEKKLIAAKNEEQAKNLQPGYDNLARAQRDLGNTYAGQAAFDAEGQYNRNLSERGTSSAIDKAMRTGGSAGEIMNMVSGLTARGQSRGQGISSEISEKKQRLQGMSQAQAIQAAQTGLAGKQAMNAIKDKTYQEGLQAQQMISQAYGEQAEYNAGIANDVASAGMMYGNFKATGNLAGDVSGGGLKTKATSKATTYPGQTRMKIKTPPVKVKYGSGDWKQPT